MHTTWIEHLTARGARIEDGRVHSFGDPQAERSAAAIRTVVADLSHAGLIAAGGPDAVTFLQGQLTNDVRRLGPAQAQFAAYCTPKGRALANFLVWKDADEFCLQLAAELQAPVQKRLSMYVLRSKVQLRDARNEFVRLGVAGPQAAELLRGLAVDMPDETMRATSTADAVIVRLHGARYFVATRAVDTARRLWDGLREGAVAVGAPAWDWLEIQAGVPWVSAATQEQFVPQMLNFERIGGVNFQKGCYPGQEIVARSQYLGQVKRRLYRAHLAADAAPQAGDALYGDDPDGQPVGILVNVAPAPGGGFDALAVVQTASAGAGPVRHGGPQGPVVALMALAAD